MRLLQLPLTVFAVALVNIHAHVDVNKSNLNGSGIQLMSNESVHKDKVHPKAVLGDDDSDIDRRGQGKSNNAIIIVGAASGFMLLTAVMYFLVNAAIAKSKHSDDTTISPDKSKKRSLRKRFGGMKKYWKVLKAEKVDTQTQPKQLSPDGDKEKTTSPGGGEKEKENKEKGSPKKFRFQVSPVKTVDGAGSKGLQKDGPDKSPTAGSLSKSVGTPTKSSSTASSAGGGSSVKTNLGAMLYSVKSSSKSKKKPRPILVRRPLMSDKPLLQAGAGGRSSPGSASSASSRSKTVRFYQSDDGSSISSVKFFIKGASIHDP